MTISARIDLRCLQPRSTCAVCGREVDALGATVIAARDDPEVEPSASGRELLLELTPGEQLVLCEDCRSRQL